MIINEQTSRSDGIPDVATLLEEGDAFDCERPTAKDERGLRARSNTARCRHPHGLPGRLGTGNNECRQRERGDFRSMLPGHDPTRGHFSLEPDHIHVWWIDLERTETHVPAVLSADERARAEQFKYPRDRARWTSARVALRQILAGYTGDHPAQLRLVRGDHGKPALLGGSLLHFSLAHARERAVLALSRNREVGIDLEPIEPRLDVSMLMEVVCSQSEVARLDALHPAARLEAFLTYWTLKEAYLKGIGTGLSRDPRTIEIVLHPDGRAEIRDSVPHKEPDWSVRFLDAGPGWTAALAIPGHWPSVMV
jgi:4'-phosphopantetheinyl transferase